MVNQSDRLDIWLWMHDLTLKWIKGNIPQINKKADQLSNNENYHLYFASGCFGKSILKLPL